jgi:glycerophosphoryl diester phosphodiesterase
VSRRPVHPFLQWDGPIAFAHRGGAGAAPENTMAAFEHAVGLGFRYLETDVQVTADGVLVAFHDDELFRTTGRSGRISALPWPEVRSARVGGTSPIPTLEDLLGAWPEVRLNIDCKTDLAVDALVATLRRHSALDRVCVGAFNDRRLRRLRRLLGQQLCTSMGPAEIAALRFGVLRQPSADAAQVPVRQNGVTVTNRALLQRAGRAGVAVHVWTVDDPAEMHRLLDLGVDGIMTDRPALLREVLEARGQWR